MSFAPYAQTTWTNGSTPLSQTNLNHLETSYSEAVQTLPQYAVAGFVLYGLVASKDVSTANQLDVTAGVAWLVQTDSTIAYQAITASSGPLTTSSPTATYFLDLNPLGTYSFATSHSGTANYLTIATVTTDGSGNILTVTDTRLLNCTLFPASLGSVGFGVPSVGGLGFDQLGTAVGMGVAQPGAPTATAVTGSGSLTSSANYNYEITYVSYYGESALGTNALRNTGAFTRINLTAIPTGPAGTLKRNIYRTKGNGSAYFFLATLADNTTTTFTDTIADASLVTAAPVHPTMGGDLWKNNSGTLLAAIYGDGTLYTDTGALSTNGSGGFTTFGGMTVAGNLGVPVLVAQAIATHVTATTQQTILTYTPAATGVYEIKAYVWQGNSAGELLTMLSNYTDPETSSARTPNFINTSGVSLNGSNSFGSAAPIYLAPQVFRASSAANILVKYTDPANTPSDYVTVLIYRLE